MVLVVEEARTDDDRSAKILASADDKTVTVPDVSDPAAPEIVAQLSGSAGQLYSVASSPDGTA